MPEHFRVWGAVRRLASLRLAAVLIANFFAVLVADAQGWIEATDPARIVLLVAMSVNLLASVATRWSPFTKKPALLLFHLALVAMIVLGAVGRLLYFEGSTAVVERERTTLAVPDSASGRFVPDRVSGARAALYELDTSYFRADDMERTRALIGLYRGEEEVLRGDVLPNEPLVDGGLRVYLNRTRGYGAVFWLEREGAPPEQGVIYFPEYVRHPEGQEQQLWLPGTSETLSCRLAGTLPYTAEGPWSLKVAADEAVWVRLPGSADATRLGPGEAMGTPWGRLRLDSVRRYAVLTAVYDPAEPWIVGLAMFQACALGWHFLARGKRDRRAA